MPTFKPVVSAHQKRSDGSYNIKIRITHKRVSRWIPTNLNAYAYDLTRSLNLKNKDLEWKCNDLIRQMRANIILMSSGESVSFTSSLSFILPIYSLLIYTLMQEAVAIRPPVVVSTF